MGSEKLSGFSRSVSFRQRSVTVGSPRVSRKSWVSKRFRILVVIGSVVSFVLAISGGYLYVLPSLTQPPPAFNGVDRECDVYGEGDWVKDSTYPLYNASECPFVEPGFNCLGNGRTDRDYMKLRWKPKRCDIPRFNVNGTLELLRNKRVVFVGDSMGRTQWESLICLLMTGVRDKRTVFEVNGNAITKQIRFLGVKFASFNFTVEFYRSVYLVQHNWSTKHAPKRVRSTLRLDRLDEISVEWRDTDILIFNSGQWWVPGKLFGTGCYFEVGHTVRLGMSIPMAFRRALQTWATWVDATINPNRTQVFFRTYEPSHWRNLTLRECEVPNHPLHEGGGDENRDFSDAIFDVVEGMSVPITVLHVTPMSSFRSDAHVGTWSDNPSLSDCSHWCLPGVPDVWNEILLSYLLHPT